MPTCLLTCEGCGTRQPSVVDADAFVQLEVGKTLLKHCLVCRTTTDWTFAFPDRRSGTERRTNVARLDFADRRVGGDRRTRETAAGKDGE